MVSGLAWVSACAVSASLAVHEPSIGTTDLPAEVRAALQETLPARGEIDDAEGRKLLALYERAAADEALTEREKVRLVSSLRRRLVSAAEQAHRRATRQAKSVAVKKDNFVLAQQRPAQAAPPAPANGGANANGPALDAGDDLARLIVATIAPDSWEQNGGNGSIYYYQQWQCLVVRQTDDIHNRLGRLVVDLRQP